MDRHVEQLIIRLKRNANDMQAYGELKNIYRQQQDFYSLINLIEGWAGQSKDKGSASHAYQEAAEVAFQDTRDSNRSIGLLHLALTLNPLNIPASDLLESILLNSGNYHELANFLNHQIQTFRSSKLDREYIGQLEYRLASLFRDKFQQLDRALNHYYRAMKYHPALLAAIYEAREICLATGDYNRAADLNRLEANAESDIKRKIALFCELADLYATELNDIEASVDVLRSAVSLDTNDTQVMYKLANYLVLLANSTSSEISHEHFRSAAELFFQIAQQVPEHSQWQYLETALNIAPYFEEALQKLEELAETTGQLHRLPPLWVAFIASKDVSSDKNIRRIKLAKAYIDVGQNDDAIYCLQQAVEQGSDEAKELLDDLYYKTGRTPVFTDIEALTKAAKSDIPDPIEPITKSSPLPLEIPKLYKPPIIDKTAESPSNPQLRACLKSPDRVFQSATAQDARSDDDGRAALIQGGATPQLESVPPERRAEGILKHPLRSSLPTGSIHDSEWLDKPKPELTDESDFDSASEIDFELIPEDDLDQLSGSSSDKSSESVDDPHSDVLADLDSIFHQVPPKDPERISPIRSDPYHCAPPDSQSASYPKKVPVPKEQTIPEELMSVPETETETPETKQNVDDLIDELQGAISQDQSILAENVCYRILHITPSSNDAYSFLENLYKGNEDHQKLCDLLILTTNTPELPLDIRIARLREAAGIKQYKLNDINGAIDTWHTIVSLQPEDSNSIGALKRLLEIQERWDELVQVLEKEASSTYDSELEAELLEQIIYLHQTKRKDMKEATDALRQLYALRPEEKSLRDSLCEALFSTGQFQDSIPLLKEQIEECSDIDKRLPLQYKLASIYENDLNDSESAYNMYQTILKATSNNRQVLDHLERIDYKIGRYDRLLKVLEQRVAFEPEEDLPSLFIRMSTIAECHLSDTNTAADYLNQAIDLDSSDLTTMEKLSSLFEQAERYDELVELLQKWIELDISDLSRISLYRRIAQVYRDKFDNPKALSSTYRDILRIQEDKEALEYFKEQSHQNDEVVQLADYLERLIQIETEDNSLRDLKLQYGNLLYTRLSNPDRAVEVFQSILEDHDPNYKPAVDALVDASEQLGNPPILVEALEKKLAMERDGRVRIELLQKLTAIYLSDYERRDHAIDALKRWMKEDASNPEPRYKLCELLEEEQLYKELILVLDDLVSIESDEDASNRATIKAAELHYKIHRDFENAWNRLLPLVRKQITSAYRAISILSTKANRLEDLSDLFKELGKYKDLVSILEKVVETEERSEVKVALYRLIAQIYGDGLKDDRNALLAWQNLLKIEEDTEALQFLYEYASKKPDFDLLSDTLKRLAIFEADHNRKRDLLFEHSKLLVTKCNRTEDGIKVLKYIIFQLDPVFKPAIEMLINICEKVGDLQGLADTLEQKLILEQLPEERLIVARRLADICQFQLDEEQRAIYALQQWIYADAKNPEPYRRLVILLENTQQYSDLVFMLESLANLKVSKEERTSLIIKASEISILHLNDIESAWSLLERLIEDGDPSVLHALSELAIKTDRVDDLCNLFEHTEKFLELSEFLQKRANIEEDTYQKVDIYRRLARLKSERLSDVEGSVQAWQALLDITEDVEALEHLRSYAENNNQTKQLLDILIRLANLETDNLKKRDFMFSQALLYLNHFNLPKKAIEVLLNIVNHIDPEFDPAIETLLTTCEAIGDIPSLVVALDCKLSVEKNSNKRCSLAQRIADIYLSDLDDIKKAIHFLQYWAEADPMNPDPYKLLRDLYQTTEQYESLLITLDTLALLESENKDRIEAKLSAAKLSVDRLQDIEGAWKRLSGLVEQGCEVADKELIDLALSTGMDNELYDILERTGKYEYLVELLHERVNVETDISEKVDIYFKIAKLSADHLDDRNSAIDALWNIVGIKEDIEAFRMLRWHLIYIEDAEQLALVLQRLAAIESNPSEKRDFLFEYARLLIKRLDRKDEGISILMEILSNLDPQYEPAIDELISIHEASDNHSGLADALEKQILLQQHPKTRSEIARRLADLYSSHLNNLDGAIGALEKWAEADMTNPEPRRQLSILLESTSRFPELVTVLDELGGLEKNDELRTTAAIRAAKISYKELGEWNNAWNRFVPLLRLGIFEIEEEAYTVAKVVRREQELVDIYIELAQEPQYSERASEFWNSAATILEHDLNHPEQALEAIIRGYGADIGNLSYLAEVERLSTTVRAWNRLGQVYDLLLAQPLSSSEKVDILVRKADILVTHANDPSAALDCVLQASVLQPSNQDLLDRSEYLSLLANRYAELINIYERWIELTESKQEKLAFLMKVAGVAANQLDDREYADEYIKKATKLAMSSTQLSDTLEQIACEMDKSSSNPNQDALRSVINSYVHFSTAIESETSPTYLLRASKLLSTNLEDLNGSFNILRKAIERYPENDSVYQNAEKVANQINCLDALDAQLSKALSQDINPETTIAILEKRGYLLFKKLSRYNEAADVYSNIIKLQPGHADAQNSLMSCLEKAERYIELVRLIEKQLDNISNDLDSRIKLLKQIALIWEEKLINRWEAIEVWQQVKHLSPEDDDAIEALSRLHISQVRSSRPPNTDL